MGPVAAILVLAVIQGLTEYLPVSSSGHLVLGRHFLPGGESLPADATVEVLLHAGTLLAVLVYYRRRLSELLAGVLGMGPEVRAQRGLALRLAVASVPTAVIGLLFRERLELLFASPLVAATALLATGGLLWLSRRLPIHGCEAQGASWLAVAIIGLAQMVALVPGISRSGITIVVGLGMGLSASSAAAFSFLLSIPAIAGAALVKLPEMDAGAVETPAMVGAVGLSFAVGWAALGALVWLTRRRRLHWFAPYCWALGAASLVALLAT